MSKCYLEALEASDSVPHAPIPKTGKNKGAVTLTSVKLSQAMSSEDLPDSESRDNGPLLMHLMVMVHLQKVSKSKYFDHFVVLIDLCATYNFISQTVAV
jgi:hypothetical protein